MSHRGHYEDSIDYQEVRSLLRRGSFANQTEIFIELITKEAAFATEGVKTQAEQLFALL